MDEDLQQQRLSAPLIKVQPREEINSDQILGQQDSSELEQTKKDSIVLEDSKYALMEELDESNDLHQMQNDDDRSNKKYAEESIQKFTNNLVRKGKKAKNTEESGIGYVSPNANA